MELENVGFGTKAFLMALEDSSDLSKHDDENPMDDADKIFTGRLIKVIKYWIIPIADDQKEVDERVKELLHNIYTKGKESEKKMCLVIQRMYNVSRILDIMDELHNNFNKDDEEGS